MPGKKDEGAGESLCSYGIRHLRKQYSALLREAEGARIGDDRGHVHRMRVASRRLRAALPVFSPCFPAKRYRRWSRAIRGITAALGQARDLDVQITFLEEYLGGRGNGDSGSTGSPTGDGPDRSGVESLLAYLRNERALIQPHIEDIAGVFSGDGLLAGFAGDLDRRPEPEKKGASLKREAARRVRKRTASLLAYERYVREPGAIEQHHAMRIAAKKLRYTMEIFNAACEGSFRKPIRALRALQEILGEMHDCDVWIAALQTDVPGGAGGNGSIPAGFRSAPGVAELVRDRKEERERLYRLFVRFWEGPRREQITGETKH